MTNFFQILEQNTIMQTEGLCNVKPVRLTNDRFSSLLNLGIKHTKNSTLPEVLDTIMESEIAYILYQEELSDPEIRGTAHHRRNDSRVSIMGHRFHDGAGDLLCVRTGKKTDFLQLVSRSLANRNCNPRAN